MATSASQNHFMLIAVNPLGDVLYLSQNDVSSSQTQESPVNSHERANQSTGRDLRQDGVISHLAQEHLHND